MKKIQDILKDRKPPNKKAIKHEWQAFAYKIWFDLGKDKKHLARVMVLVKKHNKKNRRQLEDAYRFCVDYNGRVPKIMLFYWKYWKLYNAR